MLSSVFCTGMCVSCVFFMTCSINEALFLDTRFCDEGPAEKEKEGEGK